MIRPSATPRARRRRAAPAVRARVWCPRPASSIRRTGGGCQGERCRLRLIFKASGVFNFAQGIMVVFAALTLVGLYAHGVPAFIALALTIGVMLALAIAIERFVLRPLINQAEIILFMATFGLTYILIGAGELIFGGDPKIMISEQLLLPSGDYRIPAFGGFVQMQKIDIAAAIIASLMVVSLGIFFQKTRIGRALRAVADSHRAALSVGISLEYIWVKSRTARRAQ